MDLFVVYIVFSLFCLASVAKKENKVYDDKTFPESQKVIFHVIVLGMKLKVN